jgi:hypothetical protein
MMTYGIDKRGEEPPDSDRDPSIANIGVCAHSEWPYFVFVFGLFLLIALRSLLFS